MVRARNSYPKAGPSMEKPKDFDDFLETLNESDSDDSDDDNDNANDGEDAESDSEEEVVQENGSVESNEEEEESDLNDENDSENDDGEDQETEENEVIDQSVLEGDQSDDEEGSDAEDADADEQTAAEHKKSLQRLQETDPDFFEYLKENDADLLKFNDSEEDSESDEEDAIHKPPEELEEASDSEAEEERVEIESKDQKVNVEHFIKKGIVNLHVIADWETKLSTTREIGVFVNVIEAFDCAVQQVLQDETPENQKWKVDGSANFNALVRLCVKHVKGFCVRFLCGSNNLAVSEQKFDQRPMEFKEKSAQKWSKLRSKIRAYMATLVQFLKSMGNSDAVASILKHCQKMSGFWALMAAKSYKLLRTLINIWSQGEDSCRVLAFLTINRMANYNREVFLLRVFKQMYISYVANCKFTSVNTWPAMNFMRSSLTEVYLLDSSLAYSTAFPFIRQLAIHLRNAVTAGTPQNQHKQNKKEASKIVYSWQFVHSLHLWTDVLAQAGSSDENLKLLVYPIVQVCLGTIKLIPTKKYLPLRFLIIRMLIKLQEKAGVFIPVLPSITEVLFMTDFSSKSVSKFSVRPLDMTCCLKADAQESGYAKAVSENAFELILAACKAIATELSFPEIVTPTLMQLRSFLKKKCKNPEVSRKFKTLIEKIEANSKYISSKRNKALESGSTSLSDMESQKILQVQMETSKPHPPILEFATEYFKVNAKAQAKMRKVNVETREEKLIPKPTPLKSKSKKADNNNLDGGQIFGSDIEDSDDEFKTKLDPEEAETKPKKKSKLKRKLVEQKDDDDEEETQKVKKKKKKNKKSKFVVEIQEFEAQDELVDLDLSD